LVTYKHTYLLEPPKHDGCLLVFFCITISNIKEKESNICQVSDDSIMFLHKKLRLGSPFLYCRTCLYNNFQKSDKLLGQLIATHIQNSDRKQTND